MWRFLNSTYRAIRQQYVHAPRPSVVVCNEEEEPDVQYHAVEKWSKSSANQARWSQGIEGCESDVVLCGPYNAFKKQKKQNGWVIGKTTNPGKEEEGDDWWRSCQYDFWKLLDGSHRIFDAVSVTLGSALLWGTDKDRNRRKAQLLYRVLFAIPGHSTPVLGIKAGTQQADIEEQVQNAAAPIASLAYPGERMAIKDAEGSAHDAAVNRSKTETLDSTLEEFDSLCVEYTARSHSLMGLEAADKGDMATAVEHLHSSCKLGNTSAAFNLGLCYETGSGVSKDYDKAKHFYKKAADSGHSLALYNLGLMYLDDSQDVTEEGAACSKRPDSKTKLEAIQMLEKAARLGLAEAQTYLGIHHMEETRDVSKAIQYFRAAAEQSDSEAQYFLAMCYEQGWGVDVNECRSAQLYSLAASAGHDLAIYNLAVFNEHGLGGLPEDRVCAKDLYKKAAELGNEQAKQKLEEITSQEKVDRWKEKLSNFKHLYQLHHKDETKPYHQHHQDRHLISSSPLSPSASSPNLSDYLHQNISYFFFGTKAQSPDNSYNKMSFDPGGGKIRFQLGNTDDIESESVSEQTNTDASCESGSGDEAPFQVFHRSNTTPNLAMNV